MIPQMCMHRWLFPAAVMGIIGAWSTACDRNNGSSVRDQMMIARTEPASRPNPEPVVNHPRTSRSRPIATVNGEPIDWQAFVDQLIQAHGLTLLQQWVLRETVMQEAKKKNATPTDADIDQEYEFTLQAEHFNGKDPDKLTPARREQLIDDWTRSRGVSRNELHLAMQRQAALRRLVRDRIQIDESMLTKEFARTHGEKVEVRHIQLEAARYFTTLKSRLEQGESFEELARRYSVNSLSKDRGGLLPPFSAVDDTVPGVFIEAAFALKPGEYTNPIEAEGSYHILKLERRIPADATTLDAVRTRLADRLRLRLTAMAMQELGSRLLMQAELRIEDPELRALYKKLQATREIEGPALIGQ